MTVPRWPLNLTQKIVAGYLTVALLSLVALTLALVSLKRQETVSRTLVQRDIRAVALFRDLRANLLAQERLERQFLILRAPDLLALREARYQTFRSDWQRLAALEIEESAPLQAQVAALQQLEAEIGARLRYDPPPRAERFLEETVVPLRTALGDDFERAAEERDRRINQALQELYQDSARAFHLTLALLLLGIVAGGGIAVRVVRSIRKSLRQLTEAVRQTAEERFDHSLGGMENDEFGRLAQEFVRMGLKLRDLKRRYLDANPLTHLPGNLAIDRELDRRIAGGEPFAHIYIDLDHFKAYGDRYGYQRGSEVIAITGEIIRAAVAAHGQQGDLIGHIGGDDYLVLTTPECAEPLARAIIADFEERKREFYSGEDFAAGSYSGIDRFGEPRTFPLMSMSIAIICSDNYLQPTRQLISEESAKMKEHLKHLPGSNYLLDRRRR